MHLNPLSHLSPKAAVRNSPIHGRGLFATAEFRPGEIVGVKGGHIFNRAMLEKIAPILGPAESRSRTISLSGRSTPGIVRVA
jgi:hypothetical protein